MKSFFSKVAGWGVVALAFPIFAHAQLVADTGWDLLDLLDWVFSILRRAPQYLVYVAVLFFFYNIVVYVVKGSDAAAKTKALQGVGWSIVGIFIMLSLWGIIAFISGTLRIGQGGTITAPLIPGVDVPDAF